VKVDGAKGDPVQVHPAGKIAGRAPFLGDEQGDRPNVFPVAGLVGIVLRQAERVAALGNLARLEFTDRATQPGNLVLSQFGPEIPRYLEQRWRVGLEVGPPFG
jgi:hypothetical protein